jgi:hypothetical protein
MRGNASSIRCTTMVSGRKRAARPRSSSVKQAILVDPDYSQAPGLYATILAWRTIQHWEPMEPTLQTARAASDRALLANSNDPWASIGRKYVSIFAREGDAAIIKYGRPVDLSPNFAYARGLRICRLRTEKKPLRLVRAILSSFDSICIYQSRNSRPVTTRLPRLQRRKPSS